MQTLASTLRGGRMALRLKQKLVAQELGMHRATVINAEKDPGKLAFTKIEQLATFYGIEIPRDQLMKLYMDARKNRNGFTQEEHTLVRCVRKGDMSGALRMLDRLITA